MNSLDKIFIVIMIIVLSVLTGTQLKQRPTRAETIAICDSIIKANSNTIFDKKNAGRLERYILIQGLVLTGELELEALYLEIQWFIDRNEQRIEALNDNLED